MLDVVAEGGEEEGEALLAAEAVEEAGELGEAEDGLRQYFSSANCGYIRCSNMEFLDVNGFRTCVTSNT